MHRVHVVQLGLELQTQLDLLFVVFRVLHVFFLKLEPHLSLAILFFLEVVAEPL
jgi:hypothetical protein